ncbi:hypothetical protein [Streptosporangium sp. NPDC051022]|uniref:hypothetical protein n=1 Tax=Streptosporangium sp. NPDC051022 TaxID=3155752 RepID=UPI0034394448
MKRWIAPVVAALLAPALVTAPATAAPRTAPDPVKALKHQLRPGHGVRVTEITTVPLKQKGKPTAKMIARVGGSLEFGPAGVAATDLTTRFTTQPPPKKKDEDLSSTERRITLRGKTYSSGPPVWMDKLPEGKRWVRTENVLKAIGSGTYQLYVNVFDPGTLRFLVREADRRLPGASGVQYTGVNTRKELYWASSAYRRGWDFPPGDEWAQRKITWRLWLDGRGLPSRLATEADIDIARDTTVRMATDSRYTGWGSRVVITAPPADQVVDFNDLDDIDDIFEPESPLNIIVERAKND